MNNNSNDDNIQDFNSNDINDISKKSIYNELSNNNDFKSSNNMEEYYSNVESNKNENKFEMPDSSSNSKSETISLYLCKKCYIFPKINFIDKEKIKLICKCIKSGNIINIKDVQNELVNKGEINEQKIKLFCENHKNKKFKYYCIKCQRNICEDCLNDCKGQSHNLIKLINEKEEKIIKKIEDEISKIKKNFIEISNYKSDFPNTETIKYERNSNSQILVKKNKTEGKSEGTGISKLHTKTDELDKFSNVNDYFFNLFKIIFNNYKLFPNYTHIININNVLQFFNSYYYKVKNSEILLKYKVMDEKVEKIKLFGEKFIHNNKDNFYLSINNELSELNEYFIINKKKRVKELVVKLVKREDKEFTNMSYIFHECTFLLSLEDVSKWDISRVNDMSHSFHGCSSLHNIPADISQWNTSKVTDMSYLFYFCTSLDKIPDSIQDWNLSKVTNMNYMFYGCPIDSMPDIDTTKVNSKEQIISENIKVGLNSMDLSQKISLPINSTVKEVLDVFRRRRNKEVNYKKEKVKFLIGSKLIETEKYLKEQIDNLKIKETPNIQILIENRNEN